MAKTVHLEGYFVQALGELREQAQRLEIDPGHPGTIERLERLEEFYEAVRHAATGWSLCRGALSVECADAVRDVLSVLAVE